MGEAAGRLGRRRAGCDPPEQEAIKRLSRSSRPCNRCSTDGQQMAMMMAQTGGVSLGYDPSRVGTTARGFPCRPSPAEVKRPREKGRTGFDREEFEPPSKDIYKSLSSSGKK